MGESLDSLTFKNSKKDTLSVSVGDNVSIINYKEIPIINFLKRSVIESVGREVGRRIGDAPYNILEISRHSNSGNTLIILEGNRGQTRVHPCYIDLYNGRKNS